MKLNNFWTRIISGIGLIVLTFYLFYQGPWGLSVFASLIAFFGIQEFLVLQNSAHKKFNSFIVAQSLVAVATMPLYPMSLRTNWNFPIDPYGAFAVIWTFSIIGAYLYFNQKSSDEARICITSHLYISAPLIMLQMLAQPSLNGHYEPLIPVLLMVLVWSSDSWAYVSGKLFGRHKLAPSISPGKTWEGLIGGSLLTALTGFLISYYGFTDWVSEEISPEKIGYAYQQLISPWGWIYTPLLGLCVGIFGTLGDLFESSLKRKAGVKDSGTIIPGHGGVLDRYDAFLFAIVVMFVLDKIHPPVIDFLRNTFGFF